MAGTAAFFIIHCKRPEENKLASTETSCLRLVIKRHRVFVSEGAFWRPFGRVSFQRSNSQPAKISGMFSFYFSKPW